MILRRLTFFPLLLLAFCSKNVPGQVDDAVLSAPAAFNVPKYEIPVDPDRYLIRPGEELRVVFIGTNLKDLRLSVDAEGRIVDREIGAVSLAGRTLSSARRILAEAVARSYTADSIIISVGAPLLVSVVVTGQVARPGRYNVYLSQHVSEVIDSAGGVLPGSSTRYIRLESPAGFLPVDLDRARYLGDPEADPYIYCGTRVVVPPALDRKVQVVGAVTNPRAIELAGDDNLQSLLALAGGLINGADSLDIYVMNDPGRDLRREGNIRSGDVIVVPFRKDATENREVLLFGAVEHGGAFAFENNLTLEQLMDKAGFQQLRANLERIVVFRRAEPDSWGYAPAQRYPISPGDRGMSFALRPHDSVFVPVKLGYISLSGAVTRPGLYPFSSGQVAQTYLQMAGGYTDNNISHRLRRVDRVTGIVYDLSPKGLVADGDSVVVLEVGPSR